MGGGGNQLSAGVMWWGPTRAPTHSSVTSSLNFVSTVSGRRRQLGVPASTCQYGRRGVAVRGADGQLEVVTGGGDHVETVGDLADDHDAGVGNGLAVGVVEDRQVVGGCPVAEVPDPVGLLSVAVDERAGQLPGLLPTDQVVHLQGEWQQRNEVVGRVGVVQSRCRGAAVDDQFEVMAPFSLHCGCRRGWRCRSGGAGGRSGGR